MSADWASPWGLCVAPMMDWTDRHCRYFHRRLAPTARLYTEMVTTGALLHGDVPRHLDFDASEHPVALQLGGSEPDDLAHAARLGQRWGYDEINLNCGCPSERVQKGAFGACLMREPRLVAQCVDAMRQAVDVPVTVKHRIGVDQDDSEAFVQDFVGTVAQAGCEVFIVHARSAWLQGLSPKQNREVPPLRHAVVHRLKAAFPQLRFVINGGLRSWDDIQAHAGQVDGVMIGRQAYHEPFDLAGWEARRSGHSAADPHPAAVTREAVEQDMVSYCEAHPDVPWPHVMRHVLGLYNGLPGARAWRRVWSDHRLKSQPVREVHALAQAARAGVRRAELAAA